MDRNELIAFIDRIEQDIRDVEGDEESMREQLIELADDIMVILNDI